jgi:tripartite-type tricarboxylate transporter receptor subunit TctC
MALGWQKILGKKVTIVVRNVEGAGGLVAENQVYTTHDAPGTVTLLAAGGGFVTAQVMGDPGITYNALKMPGIVGFNPSQVGYTPPKLGIPNIKSLKSLAASQKTIYIGRAGTYDAGGVAMDIALQKLFGAKTKLLGPYSSAADKRAAFEQGELNIMFEGSNSYLSVAVPQLIKTGKAVPLFQTGVVNGAGQLVRDPAVPGMPTVEQAYEQVYGHPPSGPAWTSLLFVIANGGKGIYAPPSTPKGVIDELTRATDEAFKNKTWIKDATNVDGAKPNSTTFVVGSALDKEVASAKLSSANISYLKGWYSANANGG